MDFDDLDDAEDDAGGITYEEDWKVAEAKKRQAEAESARAAVEEERKRLDAKMEEQRNKIAAANAPPPLPLDFQVDDVGGVPAGPEPELLKKTLGQALPVDSAFPLPEGAFFGEGGKMKMLWLHGGGTNAKISNMQVNATFKEWPDRKATTEWTIWEGIHKVSFGWNGDLSLEPFGPDFFVYFERWPYANVQWENWDGFNECMKKFTEFIKKNGPFDGCVGFDQGGELLIHCARKAIEGDSDLKGFTRFLMLFTTGSSKHLSDLGKLRPKCQIRLPTFYSWCPGDTAHPDMWYEETTLFFHRDYREVVKHGDGHMPPKFVKDTSECKRMVRFIEAMKQPGTRFVPSNHPDNTWNRHVFLPIRCLTAAPPPTGARKRLIVVHDPMKHPKFVERFMFTEELDKKGQLEKPREGKKWVAAGSPPDVVGTLRLKLEVYRLTADKVVGAEGVTYTSAQEAHDWHPKEENLKSLQFAQEDIIEGDDNEALAREISQSLAESLDVQERDHIGIVGIGTGSFIALTLAKILVRKQGRAPAGLWVVNPPTRLPLASTKVPGMLLSCPVRMLLNYWSLVGPGWCYETSTCGKFSLAVYKNVGELVKMVNEEWKAT